MRLLSIVAIGMLLVLLNGHDQKAEREPDAILRQSFIESPEGIATALREHFAKHLPRELHHDGHVVDVRLIEYIFTATDAGYDVVLGWGIYGPETGNLLATMKQKNTLPRWLDAEHWSWDDAALAAAKGVAKFLTEEDQRESGSKGETR